MTSVSKPREEGSAMNSSNGISSMNRQTSQSILHQLKRAPVEPDFEFEETDFHCLAEGTEVKYFRLFAACTQGDSETAQECIRNMKVEDLCQLNPLSNSSAYGLNPLHVASTVGIAKLLLEAGVPLNSRGLHSQSVLHTQYGNAALCQFLIGKGAEVDAVTSTNGSTPLQWAVAADEYDVVVVLLNAKASVNHVNDDGNTPLHLALSIEIAKVLIRHGAKTDIQNNNGRIPLEEAAWRAVSEPQHAVALYLLEHSTKVFYSLVNRESTTSIEVDNPEYDHIEAYKTVLKQEKESERWQTLNYGSTDPQNEGSSKKLRQRNSELKSVKQNLQVCSDKAKARWGAIKTTFVKNKSRGHNHHKSFISNSLSRRSFMSTFSENHGAEFYKAFFELVVKEKPGLALKVLDKQRIFLYWENTTKVYKYDTSLLGTIPMSSSAVKQMVMDGQTDLVSHPVVQYSLDIRWILFTREVMLYEFMLHILWMVLIVASSLPQERGINLRASFGENGIFSSSPRIVVGTILMLLCELFVFALNLRFIKIQLRQAQISAHMRGTRPLFKDYIHSKLRGESFYLLPHIVIILAQILRCVGGDPVYYKVAEVLYALVSWRLFYRGLCFGECFESIGVPMAIIKQMISRNLIYFLILNIVVTGFSHSMYLLYRSKPSDMQYGTLRMSWLTLSSFLFNLDVTSLIEETDPLRKYFGFFIIIVYMSMCGLVILNLVIAVMTNTYEAITKNSKGEWLLQRARIILFYEQYELALTSLAYSGYHDDTALEEEIRNFYPAGTTKHHVKEHMDGTVSIEIPKNYIDRCNKLRREKNRWFHKMRYNIFYCWKKRIRRSPSFLWPSEESSLEALGLSAEPLGPDLFREASDLSENIPLFRDGSNSNTLKSLGKRETLKIGQFQLARSHNPKATDTSAETVRNLAREVEKLKLLIGEMESKKTA